MDPDTQSSLTDTQRMTKMEGGHLGFTRWPSGDSGMYSQNRLKAWTFASRKEKKRPFHPEIKQWRELIKRVSFSHCNPWSVDFSSLQNARQNLSCEVPKSKPQPADSGGGSEKPPCSGASDEGTSQEFIKYLFSCQKQPHPPFLVR